MKMKFEKNPFNTFVSVKDWPKWVEDESPFEKDSLSSIFVNTPFVLDSTLENLKSSKMFLINKSKKRRSFNFISNHRDKTPEKLHSSSVSPSNKPNFRTPITNKNVKVYTFLSQSTENIKSQPLSSSPPCFNTTPKKKKFIFGRKRKPSYSNCNFEDVFINKTLYDDFSKYLKKKKHE